MPVFERSDRSSVNNMSEKDKKYCRCVAHVAASKQKSGGDWNVYGACRKTSPPDGIGVPKCVPYYKYEYTPTDIEISALASLKGKDYEEFKEELGIE